MRLAAAQFWVIRDCAAASRTYEGLFENSGYSIFTLSSNRLQPNGDLAAVVEELFGPGNGVGLVEDGKGFG